MFEFTSILIKTDVTAVKIIDPYIFVGVGGFLQIYNRISLDLISKTKIFEEHAIYGFDFFSGSNKFLLFGSNKIKSCTFSYELQKNCLHSFKDTACEDWILTAKFLNGAKFIACISMHNKAILFNEKFNILKVSICEEKCISYCATIFYDTWDEVVILSGTVFNEVLIWKPLGSVAPVKTHLLGHKGVIFSIDYNENSHIICSTSDDRTAIIWQLKSDLKEEINLPYVQIEPKITLFGHTARVFRCKALMNFIITAGEDSLINIWSSKGELLKKIEAHQGDSIWALDCDEKSNILCSGGGDSSINLYPLKDEIQEKALRVPETPKKLGILNSNDIVVVTENGKIYCYRFKCNNWEFIDEIEDLKSYSLLEVSGCKNLVAFAGYYGNVYIYKESLKEWKSKEKNSIHCLYLNSFCSFKMKRISRIYSLHWLHCTVIVLCQENGIISLLNLEKGTYSLVREFTLPTSKERWTTSACMINPFNFVVGDRKGHIYLYNLDNENPIQTIKKAHSYLGVTNLTSSEDEVISLGRDSTMKIFKFGSKLTPSTSDKLPFSWLNGIKSYGNNKYIFGFSGINFMMWDYNTRKLLLKKNCGGGHRSWDLKLSSTLYFAYLKDKCVFYFKSNLNYLRPVSLLSGFHVQEINTLKFIKLTEDILLVSGGEDTTLRFSKVNTSSGDFDCFKVLKSHLSSIRSIILIPVKKTNFLMFSAGGRAQIITWKLTIYNQKVLCDEINSYYEPLERDEAEIRVMDLCALKLTECVLLFAACSDGKIKVFKLDYECGVLTLLNVIIYKMNCILKIHVFEIADLHILASMATDGNVVFWNITEIVRATDSVKSKRETDKIIVRNRNILQNPIFKTNLHQSGINSYWISTKKNNRILLLSGGDDNKINLTLFEFEKLQDEVKIQILCSKCDSSVHSAHITGCFLSNLYFLTVSVDQTLVIFKWTCEEDFVDFTLLNKYNTTVGDVQGMECFEDEEGFKVILFGKGFEVLSVKKI